jgi:phosphatidylglycerol lysyltransferase
VVKGRIALALGDPIGPPEDRAGSIAAFQEFCTRNDWQPAFFHAFPEYLEHYQAAGYKVLCIGHEAILNLATFSLEGKAGRSLRTPLNRLTRLGYRTELHTPPLSGSLLRELRTLSDEWLAMMHGTEKRFALGWFDDDYIRSCPVLAVHTPEGPISAFANIVSEYQSQEITIDLMRRRQEVENGAMDFLFVALFQWAREQGYAYFNLGLSPLAGVGEKSDDPLVERAMHYIYEPLNQFYNFKGLHAFKSKFQPEWSPRYLIYPDPTSLAAVAVAVIRADSGDDFVWGYLKSRRAHPAFR